MSKNNVVSIQAGKAVEGKPAGRSQLVEHSYEIFRNRALSAVASMLERADDVLFELADKATNTTDQNLYFDAMREARLKRDSIISEFTHRLDALYRESLQGHTKTGGTDSDPYDLEGLALVDDEALEESLAVTNAVSKINSDCRESLFALDRRMGHLLSDPELESHLNPLGPENICKAFQSACSSLESDIEIRLIIFKLFEKYVTADLHEAYQQANDYLIDQGVLPEIRSTIRTSSTRPSRHARQVDSILDAEDDGGLYAALQKLLNVQMQAGLPSASPHAGGGMVTPGRIVSDLTRLQQQAVTGLMNQSIATGGGQVDHRNVVQELRESGAFATASPADTQTIDIVSMMFDYILGDDAISVPIKAQIARLQIPVLKAALLDQSLFSKKRHPVRRLLDTIAQAGIGWEERESDVLDDLTGKIESVVQRILLEFDDDIELFDSVLTEFKQYLEELEQLHAYRHDRIAKVLKGRDRIEAAKRRIKDLFAEKIIDNPVPDFVTEFLLRNWTEVLLKTFIHMGEDSPDWHKELETVDNLIWSLAPKQTREDRRKLIELLPRLLLELRAGMKKSGLDEHQRKQFLEQLSECHANAVKPAIRHARTHSDVPAKDQERAPGTMISDDIDSSAPAGNPEPVDITRSPFLRPELLREDKGDDDHPVEGGNGSEPVTSVFHTESEIEDCIEAYFRESEEVMRMLSTNELEIEEIELYEEDQSGFDSKSGTHSPEPDIAEQEHECLLQIRTLETGDWIEIPGPDDRMLRVKLHSRDSADPDKLNFVDRRGKTVLRKTAPSLAMELAAGRARILDHAPLFERAVRSVVDRLVRLTT